MKITFRQPLATARLRDRIVPCAVDASEQNPDRLERELAGMGPSASNPPASR